MLLYQSAFLALLLFRVFQSFFSGFLALSPSYFYQVFRCLKFCCSIFKDRAPRPSPGLSLSGRAFLFYYLSPFLSRGFLIFFGFFEKKRGGDKRRSLSPGSVLFRLKAALFCPNRPLLTSFFIIIYEKTCYFLSAYGIIEKSVSSRRTGLTRKKPSRKHESRARRRGKGVRNEPRQSVP